MPRLLAFLPCEHVLIDQDNRASLFHLLDDIGLMVGGVIPEGTKLPIRWSVFTLWKREESDAGKMFEQQFDLIAPDGKRILKAVLPFQMTQSLQRNMVNVAGFPLSPTAGDYTIQLFLREAIEGSQQTEIATFPLTITTGTPPADQT